MKIGIKFSQKYKNVKRRLKKLPKLFETTADSILKKDTIGFLNEFKEGLRNDNFGLRRLNRISKIEKEKKGYSKVSTPLYGAGDSTKNSYINAFRLKKIKKGYRVYLSNAKHHEANLSLKVLFRIHEEGCLIKVTPRMRKFLHYLGIHLKETTTIIRIPPRPTRIKTFKRWLEKRLINEDVKKTKRIIAEYINTGNWELFLKETFNEKID